MNWAFSSLEEGSFVHAHYEQFRTGIGQYGSLSRERRTELSGQYTATWSCRRSNES